VLTGGVSDRQENVGMAREARELLSLLEERARRGEFRRPVIDLVTVAAEDSEPAT
jgi:hypothetical protein